MAAVAFIVVFLPCRARVAADFPTGLDALLAGVALVVLAYFSWKQRKRMEEAREAQEALAASERRYRTIFENTGAATVILEADTTISLANEEFARLVGYERMEIEGRRSWTEFVAPEDLEEMRIRHRERRREPSQAPTRYEFRLVDRRGDLRSILLYIDIIPGTDQSVASLVDVTDLKEARDLAREREAMFRALAENSEDVIMRFDDRHRHLYANPAVERQTGIKPEAFIGKTHRELGFPEHLVKLWDDALEKVFKDKTSHRLEFQLPSGVWIDWLVVPELDPAGNVKAVMASARDISERRQAEEELRRSERRFRDLFEHSLDPICIHDLEGRIISINPAGAAILGRKRRDIVGRKVSDFLIPSHAADFERLYMNALRKKGCASGVMSILTDTGERRILEYNNILQKEDREDPVVRGIIRDVTDRWKTQKELEKSERKYRSIFERAAEGIFQYDRNGRFISVNNAMARMCGYASPEEMTASVVDMSRQFFVNADLPERFRAILADARRVDNFEHKVYRRDGQAFWVSMSVWSVPDAQGEVSHYEGTMMDISGRVRAEEERRRLEHDLARSQKLEAIGTLAGGVAHDFNNLLMGIQGYASLMLMGIDPSHPHWGHLKGIEKQVANGADLTKQILGFAREGGYEKRPTDMNPLIDKTTLIFMRTRKDVAVHRASPPGLWTVEADPGQMERVLMNLFVNAGQAMPGGGELRIVAENVFIDDDAPVGDLAAGKYIHIAITDTGVGMSRQTMARIFDPFFTTKVMGRGTGLGLAAVYGIVKGHGGEVLVESEPGRGSTFHIYLPATGETAVAVVEAAGEPRIEGGTERILLVDDEETVLAVSRDILESLGYRVSAARSGPEALEIMAAEGDEIALVILDMIMPGMSGGETFDRLRRIAPHLKIILSSGYSLEGQAQQIMDRGCNGFLQKPFHVDRLARKIREALGKAA